jgi:hypothetical protein
MSIFEDTGFDLLPKVPVPDNTTITIQPIEPPPIIPPTVLPIEGTKPNLIPPKKGSNTLGWFLFGLFVLGTIGFTIHKAKKEGAYKKRSEN